MDTCYSGFLLKKRISQHDCKDFFLVNYENIHSDDTMSCKGFDKIDSCLSRDLIFVLLSQFSKNELLPNDHKEVCWESPNFTGTPSVSMLL